MGIKRKLATIASAVVLGASVLLASAPQASALSSGEMTQACRVQYGSAGWEAYLYYPSQGVYGWKCYYNNAPWAVWYNERKDLSVQNYCSKVYGVNAHFSNQGDPYSWYCS